MDYKKDNQNYKLMIVTSSAIISGTLSAQTTDMSKLNQKMIDARNETLSANETTEDIIVNNVSMITLNDVTISPFANPKAITSMSIINIFSDQILGYSFGTLPQNEDH